MLVVAGAVCDERAASRHLVDSLFEFHAPDAEAPRNLVRALLPVFRVARVNEDGRAAPAGHVPSLLRAESLRLFELRHASRVKSLRGGCHTSRAVIIRRLCDSRSRLTNGEYSKRKTAASTSVVYRAQPSRKFRAPPRDFCCTMRPLVRESGF